MKEPFAFARNLKIFIIVLCCLPLVGIAMHIFLPEPLNGVRLTLVPNQLEAKGDYEYLLNSAKEGSSDDSEKIKEAMNELLGSDVKLTLSIAPNMVFSGNKVYLANPFNAGEGTKRLGVELYVFEFGYAHYDVDTAGSVLNALPETEKLPELPENTHFGAMNFTLKLCERVVFGYDYENYVIEEYSGEEKPILIKRLEINFSEDSETKRLVNTVFSELSLKTNGKDFFKPEDMFIVSRGSPSGFAEKGENALATLLTKYAYAGLGVEKGAFFKLNTDEKLNDFNEMSVTLYNIEEDRDEEIPYPAFNVEMRVYFNVEK